MQTSHFGIHLAVCAEYSTTPGRIFGRHLPVPKARHASPPGAFSSVGSIQCHLDIRKRRLRCRSEPALFRLVVRTVLFAAWILVHPSLPTSPIKKPPLNHKQRRDQCLVWIRLPAWFRFMQFWSAPEARSKPGRHMWGEQQLHLCRVRVR
jgi:hypothetical protein